MCRLFETIRIAGGAPCNLPEHQERMDRSRRELFGERSPLKLSEHLHVPAAGRNQVLRCRVVYAASILSVEYSPYVPAAVTTLKMVEAGSLEYGHKYLDRSRLTALIDHTAADDVLIIRNGCVTDASFANIAFTDGKRLVTPDTPLLPGTMRALLLRKGVIATVRITPGDLPQFTHFRLINAMLGFEAPLLPISNII